MLNSTPIVLPFVEVMGGGGVVGVFMETNWYAFAKIYPSIWALTLCVGLGWLVANLTTVEVEIVLWLTGGCDNPRWC